MRQTSRGRIARLRRRWEAGLGPFARVVRLDPDGRDTTLPEGEDLDAVLLGPGTVAYCCTVTPSD